MRSSTRLALFYGLRFIPRVCRAGDLTINELLTMLLCPIRSAEDLACDLDRPTLQKCRLILRKLVRKGLLEATRKGRRKAYALTDKGENYFLILDDFINARRGYKRSLGKP